jgi:hypothetical protein
MSGSGIRSEEMMTQHEKNRQTAYPIKGWNMTM